jgi:hypothetical protein
MAARKKVLGDRAIAQMKADHRWIAQQRRRRHARRQKWADDRQPFVLVCLMEDLKESGPSLGLLMRRDGTYTYSSDFEVEVHGDADLCQTSDPPALAGDSVICGWLHGQWRAIRRAGGCASVSSAMLAPGCVSVLKDVSFTNCGFKKEFVEVFAH